MGRLETPQKPMASSSRDPAASAKAATAKQLQATISSRNAASSSTVPDASQVKQSIRSLDEGALRTILDKVIDGSSEARAIIQAYCDTPIGSAERPFDFAALRAECLETAATFDDEDWEQINDEYYEDEKHECLRDVRNQFDSAIVRLHEVSTRTTSPVATKLEGLRNLFALVDLMQSLPDLKGDTGYSHSEVDHQLQLVATAHDAIGETIQALTPARQAQSSELDQPVFERFVKRYEELAPLVKGVSRDYDGY